MESNQVLSGDEDDFYPMNDEEPNDDDYAYAEDQTEAFQNEEKAPLPNLNANMDLFRYQESLFKDVASKKSTSNLHQLGTGSYFDYHFNKFSLKFQDLVDENETAFNVFFSLQEFIKAFKNCKIEYSESRAAALTGYLAQIKEDVERVYKNTVDKNLKAAKIREYVEMIGFLDEALIWRIEHYGTDFPDIQEKEIAQQLVQIQGEINFQYGALIKGNVKNKEQDLEKIVQKLREMKICPLWHEKVCKRLELRNRAEKLLRQKVQGEAENSVGSTPEGTKMGEKYKGEVYDLFVEEINKKKSNVAEKKNHIIIDQQMYKVSSSFDIPSGYILEGTYFDQRLKEIAAELQIFSLKNGDLPIIRALNQLIEVLNKMFNTPLALHFFTSQLQDLIIIVNDQQAKIQGSAGIQNNEMAIEILMFIMRLGEILKDVSEWKETTEFSYGDVKNQEIETLMKSVEVDANIRQEYLIDVTRSAMYMRARDYEKKVKTLSEGLSELLKARLSVKNIDCVERFDSLVRKLEGTIEGLKQIYQAKNKNYQTLKAMYENHKATIAKGTLTEQARNDLAREFELFMEDFDERFGSSISYGPRKSYQSWAKELRLMRLGFKPKVQ